MGKIKWVSIGGSSERVSEKIEGDVRKTTKEVMESGCGIISGGDFGVDYTSIDEALKHDPEGRRIMIFLPVELEIYIKHCKKLMQNGVADKDQGKRLISCLRKIKKTSPSSFVENKKNKAVDINTISERDESIIMVADEAVSFYIYQSPMMEKIIEKIKQKGIPFRVFTYNTRE